MNRKAVRHETLDVTVLILLLMSVLHTSCETTPSPVVVDPSLTIIHGQFIDSNQNVVTPTTDYILGLQQHYISQILDEIDTLDTQPLEKTRELILGSVRDSVIANGLFLDWLLERFGPDEPSYFSWMNDALRWHYVNNLQDDPILPEGDEPWTKGVSETAADKLESEGFPIVRQNQLRGQGYINRCYNEGVPVPNRIFDEESGWERLGILKETVLFKENAAGEPFRSELWWWEGLASGGHPGYCLALTRSVDGTRGHVDVICYSERFNKACFFESDPAANHTGDTQESPNPFNFPLIGPADLDELKFKGGSDLPDCLTCHAGENPFIVYPDDPAFIRAGQKAVAWLGEDPTDPNLMGSGWYTHVGNSPGSISVTPPECVPE